MNLNELERKLRAKADEITTFVERDVPDIIGVEAVNHFRESFDSQAFAGGGSPWPEVERRKPASPWYGFSAGAPKNFSQTRTTAKILHGETGELRNAFSYRREPGRVVIINDKPYAAIHNFGGAGKVFGKTPFVMKQRKFMDYSDTLQLRIDDKIYREMTNILKK
jgi:phage gpG-like protein